MVLDNLYDRISELDEEIAGVEARIQAAYEKQVTGKNVYQFLLDFDILYERMTDLEKKQFMRTFIESIERSFHVNKTFLQLMEKLGYDVELTYVKREIE